MNGTFKLVYRLLCAANHWLLNAENQGIYDVTPPPLLPLYPPLRGQENEFIIADLWLLSHKMHHK